MSNEIFMSWNLLTVTRVSEFVVLTTYRLLKSLSIDNTLLYGGIAMSIKLLGRVKRTLGPRLHLLYYFVLTNLLPQV